jgi:hypothetical protein
MTNKVVGSVKKKKKNKVEGLEMPSSQTEAQVSALFQTQAYPAGF